MALPDNRAHCACCFIYCLHCNDSVEMWIFFGFFKNKIVWALHLFSNTFLWIFNLLSFQLDIYSGVMDWFTLFCASAVVPLQYFNHCICDLTYVHFFPSVSWCFKCLDCFVYMLFKFWWLHYFINASAYIHSRLCLLLHLCFNLEIQYFFRRCAIAPSTI